MVPWKHAPTLSESQQRCGYLICEPINYVQIFTYLIHSILVSVNLNAISHACECQSVMLENLKSVELWLYVFKFLLTYV